MQIGGMTCRIHVLHDNQFDAPERNRATDRVVQRKRFVDVKSSSRITYVLPDSWAHSELPLFDVPSSVPLVPSV
jgi:hypothetical protein